MGFDGFVSVSRRNSNFPRNSRSNFAQSKSERTAAFGKATTAKERAERQNGRKKINL
jgi:hypothetical protein